MANYITAEGLQKLKEELVRLESEERPRVIAAIQEARDKGDLSENAEYDAAKEEQGKLEARISILKEQIMEARIISGNNLKTDSVQVLTKVKIRNTKNNATMTYQIVTEGEANFKEGKLSVKSPIAQGLVGKKVGEIATVKVPAGEMHFEIVEITL